jgi:hypothetical protein
MESVGSEAMDAAGRGERYTPSEPYPAAGDAMPAMVAVALL